LREALLRARDRFRAIPGRRDRSTPLIGIVGEIFCRLNTFSNENLIRRLEEYRAEAWLSDIVEWVWYTNSEHFRKLKLTGRLWTTEALEAWVRNRVQKRDEHVLLEPFSQDFTGYEEPDIYEILECARPYLPREGAFGEMVLNVGKVVYLARKGADGIIDISPFTCMNGIVCEAIYPKLSRDLGGIPIRNFYFDGTQSDLDRDLGVYLEAEVSGAAWLSEAQAVASRTWPKYTRTARSRTRQVSPGLFALQSLHRADRRLSIMFSGYLYHHTPPLAAFAILTNFQNIPGGPDEAEACDEFRLTFASERRPSDGEPTLIQRVGNWRAMTGDDESTLRSFLEDRKPPQAIIGEAIELFRQIADRPAANTRLEGSSLSYACPVTGCCRLKAGTIPPSIAMSVTCTMPF
jgi:hypothetical protein